jgi:hypothetical protein
MNPKFRTYLITILSIFLIIQSYRNVAEYLKYPSATKSGLISLSGVPVPTITICPGYGFDDAVLTKLGYSDYYSYLLGQGKDDEENPENIAYGWVGQRGKSKNAIINFLKTPLS